MRRIEEYETVVLAYPTQFSNAPYMVRDFIRRNSTFNQETTLCGHSIIRNIKKAKSLGYFVDVSFVGLESSALAVERVEQRVRDGGHGIR